MKADDIYFDSNSLPFFDDIITEKKNAQSTVPNKLASNKSSLEQQSSVKLGLGYTATSKRKENDNNVENSFIGRLKGTKKSKRNEAFELDADDEHGIVEDNEISRTAINSKPVKPTTKKIDLLAANNQIPMKVQENKKNIQSENNTNLKDSTNTQIQESFPDNGIVTNRSRPKKRSKQKNIRKDNRPASSKPDYLQPGPSYRGRPITKVLMLHAVYIEKISFYLSF